MIKSLLFIALLGAASTFAFGREAQANACHSLQMQLLQAQAAREMRQYRRVHGLMVSQGCLGDGGERRPQARIAPEREPVTVAPRAPTRQARPQQRRPEQARQKDESQPARPKQVRPQQTRRQEESRPAKLQQARPQQARQQEESRPVRPQEASRPEESSPKVEEPAISFARRTFRTFCVRSCDGYYFPISFSTTREHFEADLATCGQLCPDAEASIYYHARNEGPESMVSLEGSAYVDLPAAFRYRSGLNPSCSCGRPRPAEPTTIDATDPSGALQPAQLPRPRIALGEDPETLTNRDGRFVPHPFASSLVAAIEAGPERRVRVISAVEPFPVLVSTVPNNFPFDPGLLAEEVVLSPVGAASIEAVVAAE